MTLFAAERGEILIYVPPFVLWEIALLLKLGRLALHEEYGIGDERLIAQRGFELTIFNVAVATEAFYYPFTDPFDGVITATARVMDLH